MTALTKQIPEIIQINWHNRPIHLSLIIGMVISGVLSLGWSRFTGFSTVAVWPLGFSLGFLLMSWLHLRQRRLDAWRLAISGQFLGVISIGLFLFNSLKF